VVLPARDRRLNVLLASDSGVAQGQIRRVAFLRLVRAQLHAEMPRLGRDVLVERELEVRVEELLPQSFPRVFLADVEGVLACVEELVHGNPAGSDINRL
jgi:hypothetical protein